MSEDREEPAEPYVTVDAKRSFDKVPIQFDWHDYLSKVWQPGLRYTAGTCIRFRRRLATGLQFRCTSTGVSGRREPTWPKAIGSVITDGTVSWVAEAVDDFSLRAGIQSDDWPTVDGLTLSDFTSNDLVYTAYADGGSDGQDYEVKHRIVLNSSDAEEKEAVAVLPVRD